jgi:phosphohistidine phosphatase SixA
VFVLVRHAHAGDKRRWPGPDDQRPLSPRGWVQARELAPVLAKLGVTRLLTSPSVRCQQTLFPAADQLLAVVQPVAALAPDAPMVDLLQLLASPAADAAALCTHRETLESLSLAWKPAWCQLTGSAAPDLSGTPKGGWWIVDHFATPQACARSSADTTAAT